MDGYNHYCPWRTDHTYLRADAGCVPIAGAQMLYYLHNHLSVPALAPDWAFCGGNVDNYTQSVSGESSTTWDYMLNNSVNIIGCYSSAVLISDVGIRVGVLYGNEGSGATMSNLVSVFSHYGIDCSYTSFGPTSNNLIKQSLLDGMPVIMRAKRSSNASGGHTFIIDGYRRSRVQYTYTYEWVWDILSSPSILVPPGGRKIEVTYSSPYITDYQMNWGWGGYYNDSFFQISGDWNAGGGNYIYDRAFIYGFTVAD